MTVLSSKLLRDRLYHPEPAERLVVTPILEMKKQVAKSAIDVRLGSEFVVLRQTRLSGLVIDLLRDTAEEGRSEFALDVAETTDTTYVPLGSYFVLHPGQFVLTSTLEYVSMPRSLMAYVIGRSSWGRIGLNIATATMVAPGFKGAITFEMVNLGTVPIGLYPGSRIAQLVFHALSEPEAETAAYGKAGSKYITPVGPEFSKVIEDTDWEMLRRFRTVLGNGS